MAPKHHPAPLSRGDREALKKELSKSRAMTHIFAERSAEKRRAGEALIQEADNLACQSWNERRWSDGGLVDPSPTIDQAINGGFTIHTAPRSGMTLRATWSGITDVEGQPTWVIPAERTKMEKPHRVQLTAAAALAELGPRGADDELIFRSRIGKKENLGRDAMQLLLKEMRPGLTVHGFRTSFRDWISEDTDFNGDLGELALAHAIGGQSKRA